MNARGAITMHGVRLFALVASVALTTAAQVDTAPRPQRPSPVPGSIVGTAMPRNNVDVTFVPAAPLVFPNPTDCNSPSFWDGNTFCLFNSLGGQPRLSKGTSVDDVTDLPDIVPGKNSIYLEDIHAGAWLESVIADDETGRLYGWYHAEFGFFCEQGLRAFPVIGAVVSDTGGSFWHDLGIILTAQPDTLNCDTEHPVTAGGVGDFSVILDHNTNLAEHYAYFIFSNYSGTLAEQGVSFARMLWIDRDRPIDVETGQSRALKWFRGHWTEPGLGGTSTPLSDDSRKVTWKSADNNGYWGPSVHWNVDLKKFVILMSRSKGGNYLCEGIYMTYSEDLSDPRTWVLPKKIVEGQGQMWYPQVVGDAKLHGTDKLAGRTARYFNSGISNSLIVFTERSR